MYAGAAVRGQGVLEGFTAAIKQPSTLMKITVQPGKAIDINGEVITMTEAVDLDIPDADEIRWWFVWVRYKEVNSTVGDFKSGYSPSTTRVTDSYEFVMEYVTCDTGYQIYGPPGMDNTAFPTEEEWPSPPSSDCILICCVSTGVEEPDELEFIEDLRISPVIAPAQNLKLIDIGPSEWVDHNFDPLRGDDADTGQRVYLGTSAGLTGFTAIPRVVHLKTNQYGIATLWGSFVRPQDYGSDGHLLVMHWDSVSVLDITVFAMEWDNSIAYRANQGSAHTEIHGQQIAALDTTRSEPGAYMEQESWWVTKLPLDLSGIMPGSLIGIKVENDNSGSDTSALAFFQFRYVPHGAVLGGYWQEAGIVSRRYARW